MYFAYIRPLLEYSDVVRDNQKSYYTLFMYVTGATKLCSTDRLFMELGWESLQSRRNKHKPTTIYNIMHGLAPSYLSDLITLIVGQTNNLLSGMQIIFTAPD